METQTAVQKTQAPTAEEINIALIEFMQVLSNNENGTKTKLKGFEQQMTEAVRNNNTEEMLKYQKEISNLINEHIKLQEAAEQMSNAIFSDIRNLDPNWWTVGSLIGNTTTDQIWGYSWSTSDQDAFIAFINEVVKDKENTFTNLAVQLRSSEENSLKYRTEFKDYIELIQGRISPKMSDKLVNTLVRKSSYPCSEAELETLFDKLIEPITW